MKQSLSTTTSTLLLSKARFSQLFHDRILGFPTINNHWKNYSSSFPAVVTEADFQERRIVTTVENSQHRNGSK